MRTNLWLANRLEYIKNTFFSDIPIKNQIIVKFGPKTRRRLGCIYLEKIPGYQDKVSIITLSAYMRSESIPLEIIDITLAHEFVHYSHGFSSPLPRLFRYPHQGSVVNKELRRRGLSKELRFHNLWIRQNWRHLVS